VCFAKTGAEVVGNEAMYLLFLRASREPFTVSATVLLFASPTKHVHLIFRAVRQCGSVRDVQNRFGGFFVLRFLRTRSPLVSLFASTVVFAQNVP
jgi:hypothetical protein